MKTVLAHGVFDLLHLGHVIHLEQAKAFGDRLFVSVLTDRFVKKPYRINNQDTRRAMVAALRCEYAICARLGIMTKFTVTSPPHTSDLITKIKAL